VLPSEAGEADEALGLTEASVYVMPNVVGLAKKKAGLLEGVIGLMGVGVGIGLGASL
jgi:hypothetical protein